MASDKKPILVKAVMLGDEMVGKTSILNFYRQDAGFDEKYVSTIGVDFVVRTIEKKRNQYKLQLWDTGGQERFRNITASYIRGSGAIILVYDLTKRESFTRLDYWKGLIDSSKSEGDKTTCLILVGNKLDKESQRQVLKEEGQIFADSLGIPFFEVSAKDKTNIEDLFNGVIHEVNKRDGTFKWWQKF